MEVYSNESCGWYAISRDGINMITFYKGKFTFSQNDDVTKFYKYKTWYSKVKKLIKTGNL